MFRIFSSFINAAVSILTLIVFVYVLLGYFLRPDHQIRRALAVVVEPMLSPVRKVIRPIGGFDLSPLIVILLLQVIGSVLVRLLGLILVG